MRIISYRNKRFVHSWIAIITILFIASVLFVICRFIYLQRYLVFTDQSVQLDYGQDIQATGDTPAEPHNDFVLEYVEDDMIQASTALSAETSQPVRGYYITTSMLLDLDAVTLALSKLDEPPQTLLFEVKSIYGNYYYGSSLLGSVSANADISGIDRLLADCANDENIYLVAKVPAFTDNNFALAYQSCGLPLRSGALWMDEKNCYWLDPMSEHVQEHLISIAMELSDMGFDEIVFDNFRIPDSQNIVYDSGMLTREEAAAEAAASIRAALEDLPARISFGSESPLVAAHTNRVYLTTNDGSSVLSLVSPFETIFADLPGQIIFQTASRDTRFEKFGILRPLIEQNSVD